MMFRNNDAIYPNPVRYRRVLILLDSPHVDWDERELAFLTDEQLDQVWDTHNRAEMAAA